MRRFNIGVLEWAVWVAETEATRDFISTFLPEHSESYNTINVMGEGLCEIGITAARPFPSVLVRICGLFISVTFTSRVFRRS